MIKILISLSSSTDALDYFTEHAMNETRADVAAHKSRSTLVWLSPDEFLNLARKGFDADKKEKVEKLDRFDSIPFLLISNTENGISTVVGHEGRHRSMKLKRLGIQKMPVKLRSTDIRWGEQLNDKKHDYIPDDKWPKFLQAQDSNTKIPFPTTREKAHKVATSSLRGRSFFESLM